MCTPVSIPFSLCSFSLYCNSFVHHLFFIIFLNDTATTEIYTLSLHDALPISRTVAVHAARRCEDDAFRAGRLGETDRKSTRLNSSHANISYAVFCLKKKKKKLADIGLQQRNARGQELNVK